MQNKWKLLLNVLALHSQFLCYDTEGQAIGIQIPDSFIDARSLKLKLDAMTFMRTAQHRPKVELYQTHGMQVRVTYLEGYVTLEIT
jgi:hypothetical protein